MCRLMKFVPPQLFEFESFILIGSSQSLDISAERRYDIFIGMFEKRIIDKAVA